MTPEALGLSSYGTTRRVPGLQREELAQLAGLSAGYYTRLEQGQAGCASSQVLDALARVLRLDDVETAHLHNLARGPAISRLEAPDEEEPDSHVLALLHALGGECAGGSAGETRRRPGVEPNRACSAGAAPR